MTFTEYSVKLLHRYFFWGGGERYSSPVQIILGGAPPPPPPTPLEERNDENQSIETNHLGNELEVEQHEIKSVNLSSYVFSSALAKNETKYYTCTSKMSKYYDIYPPLSKEIAI